METHRKLGEILVSMGGAAEPDVRRALGHQHRWGGKLGRILVEMGACTEEALARAVAAQTGVQYLQLPDEVPEAFVRRLTLEASERHTAVVVGVQGAPGEETYTVAVSDPESQGLSNDLRTVLGRPARIVVAEENRIKQIIQRVYHGEGVSKTTPIELGDVEARVDAPFEFEPQGVGGFSDQGPAPASGGTTFEGKGTSGSGDLDLLLVRNQGPDQPSPQQHGQSPSAPAAAAPSQRATAKTPPTRPGSSGRIPASAPSQPARPPPAPSTASLPSGTDFDADLDSLVDAAASRPSQATPPPRAPAKAQSGAAPSRPVAVAHAPTTDATPARAGAASSRTPPSATTTHDPSAGAASPKSPPVLSAKRAPSKAPPPPPAARAHSAAATPPALPRSSGAKQPLAGQTLAGVEADLDALLETPSPKPPWSATTRRTDAKIGGPLAPAAGTLARPAKEPPTPPLLDVDAEVDVVFDAAAKDELMPAASVLDLSSGEAVTLERPVAAVAASESLTWPPASVSATPDRTAAEVSSDIDALFGVAEATAPRPAVPALELSAEEVVEEPRRSPHGASNVEVLPVQIPPAVAPLPQGPEPEPSSSVSGDGTPAAFPAEQARVTEPGRELRDLMAELEAQTDMQAPDFGAELGPPAGGPSAGASAGAAIAPDSTGTGIDAIVEQAAAQAFGSLISADAPAEEGPARSAVKALLDGTPMPPEAAPYAEFLFTAVVRVLRRKGLVDEAELLDELLGRGT